MLNTDALIRSTAAATGMNLTQSKAATEAVIEAIEQGLLAGQTVKIGRIGKLEPKTYGAFQCKVPSTGQLQDVPPRIAVHLVRAKKFQKQLNGNGG